MFRYLPEQASDFAAEVDHIHNLVTDISVFFTVAIVGTMIYFAIRYRKRDGADHETPQIEGSTFLEILWTVVPAIICVIVAAYGYIGFNKIRNLPPGEEAVEINVTGKQWAWSFKYPNGKEVGDEFYVPVGKPVKLILTSTDVLHSFFLPGMRTKMDAIPGRYTYQWFRPIKTGPQQAYCTEFCGTRHAGMLAKMQVVSEGEYEKWVNDKGGGMKPADLGRQIYTIKACNSCHSLDGSRLVGPSFLNLYNRKGKLEGGQEYIADENYIKESILNPQAKLVEGFPHPSPMPSFEGQLSDSEIDTVIAFIKSVKGEAPKAQAQPSASDLAKLSPAERGKAVYQSKACAGCHSLDGSKLVGPSFKGIYKREAELDDGTKYVADETYIKESIMNPQAKIVKGFSKPSAMPAMPMTDQEIQDIIEFMKTVK